MNPVMPYITLQDKVNESYLEEHPTPALIIEGSTDYGIYGHLLKGSNLDWDKIDIVIGECKKTILASHDAGLPFDYLALLDSDYQRYLGCCRVEPNLVYTHYYSMENYLAVPDVIRKTFESLRTVKDPQPTAEQIVQEAIQSLEPLLAVCLMKLDCGWPVRLERLDIERWWNNQIGAIDEDILRDYVIGSLAKEGTTVSVEDWTNRYSTYLAQVRAGAVELLVTGKHKVQAVYRRFRYYLPRQMSRRDKYMFTDELCSNVLNCLEAQELVRTLDASLGPLFA